MEGKIMEFARLLRKGGLNISFSQVADALRAVAEVGFQQEDFYQALACTLVCEEADKPLFDKMFRLFFLTLPASYQYPGQPESMAYSLELARTADGSGAGRGAGASPALLLVKAVREENHSLLNHLAQVAFQSLGNPRREELVNLEQLLVQAKVAIGWYEAVNRLERIKEREGIGEHTYSRWVECLEYLEQQIKKRLEDYFVRAFGRDALEELVVMANLRVKEFYQLNQLEVEEIRKRITRLGSKLASKYARRYRKAKHGEVDLRRTVRNALKTGGTPLSLKYRKKKLSRPEIVLLCDVSGSVALFSEFMLQLIYTIQNRFRSVRSFLFVDRIEEVTGYFRNEDIEAAVQEAFSKATFSYSGFSDFGKVFALFATRYLKGISPRSTLIILGDAKNNWRSPEQDYLKEISQKVRRVLWFNPQPRGTWDTEDSIMQVYAPYCQQVFECRNLIQLEQVIQAIL